MWWWMTVALAQSNLDFEQTNGDTVVGWATGTSTADAGREGGTSLRIHREDHRGFDAEAQRIAVTGDVLTVGAWIRTERLRRGGAGLWARADGPDGMLGITNSEVVRRTRDWTWVEAELALDPSTQFVLFGPLVRGRGTAWFDDLRLTVDGAPVEPVVATPIRHPDRPWTPEEQRPAPDPRAGAVDEPVRSWVAEHHVPLHSVVSEDFGDLAPFGDAIGDARIVQLGESGHGFAEFNHLKVRLIKYLHQHHGFDVLAFESGLWECERAGALAAELTTDDLRRRCAFGVWSTAEVLELWEYVRATAGTDRPLRLTGFDPQQSSRTGSEGRSEWLAALITPVDPDRAAWALEGDAALLALQDSQAMPGTPEATAEFGPKAVFYAELEAWLTEHRDALVAHTDPREVDLAIRLAHTKQAYIAQRAAADGTASYTARDEGMAANLDWLADHRYPDDRIVVWAHNGHVRTGGGQGPNDPRWMGAWLTDRRDDVYTVGLYAYRGTAALNSRSVYRLAHPGDASLEAILFSAGTAALFLDWSRAPSGPGTDWLSVATPTLDWGSRVEPLVLREAYDGVLFVVDVTAPTYVTSPSPDE